MHCIGSNCERVCARVCAPLIRANRMFVEEEMKRAVRALSVCRWHSRLNWILSHQYRAVRRAVRKSIHKRVSPSGRILEHIENMTGSEHRYTVHSRDKNVTLCTHVLLSHRTTIIIAKNLLAQFVVRTTTRFRRENTCWMFHRPEHVNKQKKTYSQWMSAAGGYSVDVPRSLHIPRTVTM